jgi:hypothetical protein
LLRFLAAVALLPCQACAFNYIDAKGDRHTIGLVDIDVHPPAAPQTFAGDVVEVAAIGMILSITAQGGHIAIGYSHEATAELKDDVLVIGDPLGLAALASSAEAPKNIKDGQ